MVQTRSAVSPPPLLATAVALVLVLVVPLLLWQFGTAPSDSSNVLLTVVIAVSGTMFSVVVGARDRRLHEMVFWLFVYLFLGVAPFIQTRSKFPGTTPGVEQSYATHAALVGLIGCGAFILGTRAVASGPHSAEQRRVSTQRAYILVLCALGMAAVYVAQIGPENLFAARTDVKLAREASVDNKTTAVLISAGARMGLLVAFVSLMQLRRQRMRPQRATPTMLAALVALVLFACVNPISSARYTFGTVFLAVLATLGAYATVRRFRVVALSALAGLVLVFPMLDTFRRSLNTTLEAQSPVDAMTTGDFDAFPQIINTYEYTAESGLTWGNQLLGVLLFWIPRSMWPSKPIDTGTMIAEYHGYRFTNLSEPLWAELFVNFGWVGVGVGLFAFGMLIRRLDLRSEASLKLTGIPDVLGCITPFYLLIVLRGSLLQAMANLIVILVAAWFVRGAPIGTPGESELRHRQPASR